MEETVRPVLVFDQFEEFFTISEKSDNELKNIITEICDIAGDFLPASLEKVLNDNNETLPFPSDGKYRIVLSLRDDFIARVDEISHLCPPLRQNRVPVKAMNTVNAMEVVYNRNTGDIVSE